MNGYLIVSSKINLFGKPNGYSRFFSFIDEISDELYSLPRLWRVRLGCHRRCVSFEEITDLKILTQKNKQTIFDFSARMGQAKEVRLS